MICAKAHFSHARYEGDGLFRFDVEPSKALDTMMFHLGQATECSTISESEWEQAKEAGYFSGTAYPDSGDAPFDFLLEHVVESSETIKKVILAHVSYWE